AACFFLGTTIWMTDTGAFFIGRQLGGAKLNPDISPAKTWSGALGGLFTGTLAGLVIWIIATPSPVWIGLVIAAAVSIAGQLGDLTESAIKRNFQIKDTSDVIPGHGGLMDRLDSLTFGALLVFAIGAVHLNLYWVAAGLMLW
ncbi:MAG TPA: CDP-archaeol synthase, partial [Devosia sp.]|nr:CDP-archaeol synthase [Devosia sp.]